MNQLKTKEPYLEVYGSLTYIGLDGEGNTHIIVKKESSFYDLILKSIKTVFEGKEVKIRIGLFKRD